MIKERLQEDQPNAKEIGGSSLSCSSYLSMIQMLRQVVVCPGPLGRQYDQLLPSVAFWALSQRALGTEMTPLVAPKATLMIWLSASG